MFLSRCRKCGCQNEKIRRERRKGIGQFANESNTEELLNFEIIKHSKELVDETLIKSAIQNNEFLGNLLDGTTRLQDMIDAMYSRNVTADEIIIQEGDPGNQLFISGFGVYAVKIKKKLITSFNDNRVFGELAILYNEKRQATIQALSHGQVWVLDQKVYQKITLESEIEHRAVMLQFLKNIPKLNAAPEFILKDVVDLLKREFFTTGTVIIQQGTQGDKFYIINAGSVTVSKEGEVEVNNMARGDFFGEVALLTGSVRQATVTANSPGVECFSLSYIEFISHFGEIDDIKNIANSIIRDSEDIIVNSYRDIELADLVKIGTLGEGGFGRVELVQHKVEKELLFALKVISKSYVIEQELKENVYAEKINQMCCNSNFIVSMHKTLKDSKCLYFLLEVCLGGDLYTFLHKQKGQRFEENAAKFYAASTLEALNYLHDRNIIYRDLKTENVLLTLKGHVKLSDFGFTKKLEKGDKTYTFVGTPEYMAPELIRKEGHNYSVDFWAFGIFIFELLIGKTPFFHQNNAEVCNLILRGIDKIKFPKSFSSTSEDLIKKLCKFTPTDRLGCQHRGVADIKDHPWFRNFSWVQLQAGQLNPPFKFNLKNKTDLKNFDKFKKDNKLTPDVSTGWDIDF